MRQSRSIVLHDPPVNVCVQAYPTSHFDFSPPGRTLRACAASPLTTQVNRATVFSSSRRSISRSCRLFARSESSFLLLTRSSASFSSASSRRICRRMPANHAASSSGPIAISLLRCALLCARRPWLMRTPCRKGVSSRMRSHSSDLLGGRGRRGNGVKTGSGSSSYGGGEGGTDDDDERGDDGADESEPESYSSCVCIFGG
ncbi:hypothetical protein PENSPDRAFT_311264 [Peniophora sp. CONT]|nr:hypothetical protein PENSPDRAFT_311264 [Peniophora sp. CONT]